MKNSIITDVLFAVLPCVGYAETYAAAVPQYSYNESVYYQVTPAQSNSQPRLFVAINSDIYSALKYKESGDYIETYKEDTYTLNNSGSIGIGIDISDGIFQLSFNPGHQESEDVSVTIFDIKVDISLPTGDIRPYISLIGGLKTINIDDYDIEESTFGYGIGLGAKYYINDNMFTDLGLTYSKANFDVNVYEMDVEVDFTGISLHAGLGYRF